MVVVVIVVVVVIFVFSDCFKLCARDSISHRIGWFVHRSVTLCFFFVLFLRILMVEKFKQMDGLTGTVTHRVACTRVTANGLVGF